MLKRLLKSLRQSVHNPVEKGKKENKGSCKALCAKAQMQQNVYFSQKKIVQMID